MMGARAILLGCLFLLPARSLVADCTPAEFQGWFQDASRGTLRLPDPVRKWATDFRYVFVGGFANERMPGYFWHSSAELRAIGVPPGAIHYLFPSSNETIEGNGAEVGSRFREFASKGPEKLVVIAHSRGACDALAFAIQNESFVIEHVEAIFLIQGALGGTGVADYLLGEGISIDRRMPLRLRVLAYLVAKFETMLLNRGKHGGLASLTRTASERFWNRMLSEHAEAVKVVGPKTYYITSQIHPSRLRLFHRAVATYLQTYYGPNDGVVALVDQSVPGLGVCLGVFEAGHTDFTHRAPASRAPRRLRIALMQSLVMALGNAQDIDPGSISGPKRHRIRKRFGFY